MTTFKNFNLGHLLILIFGLGGTTFLGLHGDAKIESSRAAVTNELRIQLAPLEKRIENVEECDKKIVAIRVELARLVQAIHDSGRFPRITPDHDEEESFVLPRPAAKVTAARPRDS